MATRGRPAAAVLDVPEDVDEAAEDEGAVSSGFCETSIDDMPQTEYSLYKRVSTTLNKAGISSADQLTAMRYAQRRRIDGLGANGLELIEETLSTGDPERIALLFQEPGRRPAGQRRGPTRFKGVPSYLSARLEAAGITEEDQLRELSDDELKDAVKGLGRGGIAKIRHAFPPPALTSEELDAIEAKPGKIKGTVVLALIAELRQLRANADGTSALASTNGYTEPEEDDADEEEDD